MLPYLDNLYEEGISENRQIKEQYETVKRILTQKHLKTLIMNLTDQCMGNF